MRWSNDGGSTYEAGAASYAWSVTVGGSHVRDDSDSEIQVHNTIPSGNDANNAASVTFLLINPNASSERTTSHWQGSVVGVQATPEMRVTNGCAAFIQGADAIDAVQFLWSGGSTFKAQGDISVWRRKRS